MRKHTCVMYLTHVNQRAALGLSRVAPILRRVDATSIYSYLYCKGYFHPLSGHMSPRLREIANISRIIGSGARKCWRVDFSDIYQVVRGIRDCHCIITILFSYSILATNVVLYLMSKNWYWILCTIQILRRIIISGITKI